MDFNQIYAKQNLDSIWLADVGQVGRSWRSVGGKGHKAYCSPFRSFRDRDPAVSDPVRVIHQENSTSKDTRVRDLPAYASLLLLLQMIGPVALGPVGGRGATSRPSQALGGERRSGCKIGRIYFCNEIWMQSLCERTLACVRAFA